MKARNGGYILLFVLFALTIVATAVLLLSRGSSSLTFESDRTYRELRVRNLLASGRSWVQVQSEKGPLTTGQITQLGTDASALTGEELTVTVLAADRVRIQAAAARVGHTLRREEVFAISNSGQSP